MELKDQKNTLSGSSTFLESTLSPHSRFKGCTQHVVHRRGKKPEIRVPIFQDTDTKIKEVILDHYAYGMSYAGLQITFSSRSMDECRFLYGQTHVLSAFAQALSNSSAIVNGKLMNWDSRWKIIEQSADDRNSRELGRIDKSRYGTANLYISNDSRNRNAYNDIKYTLNKKFRKNLKQLFK